MNFACSDIDRVLTRAGMTLQIKSGGSFEPSHVINLYGPFYKEHGS